MIIKTSELEGAALDWAVAKSQGLRIAASLDVEYYGDWLPLDNGSLHEAVMAYMPSLDWSQGGPLIEKYQICTGWLGSLAIAFTRNHKYTGGVNASPTILVAAMRAIVAAELGETVDVPEELIK